MAPTASDVPSLPERPPRGEFAAVLWLLGGFLALNLATYNYYPAVWRDEVWFAEAAVNLVKYGSFTAMNWQLQPHNTFPVVNCPLYTMGLAPWLAVAGTGVLAVRSFNYTLMSVAVFLCWLISWRFGLVRSTRLRLVMVVVLHLGYGMSYCYRSCRPDILAMVCLLMLALAFQIRRPRLRLACLAGLAAALVWIGLQAALFAWFAGAAVWLVLRRSMLREMVVLSLGMALGAGSLTLLLAWKGVLTPFLAHSISFLGKHYAHTAHPSASGALWTILHRSVRSYMEDVSMLALALGLAVLLATTWKRLSYPTRQRVIYCLVVAFGVPLLFNIVGHYALYYSYMLFVPITLAALTVYSELLATGANLRLFHRLVFGMTIAAVIMIGLPLRLALCPVLYSHVAPQSEIRRVVQAQILPIDVVFTEHAAFFEAKQIARTVYDVFTSPTFFHMPEPGARDLTAEEKRSISVLVIRPERAEQATNSFGGSWTAVSGLFGDVPNYQRLARLPLVGARLIHHAEQAQNARWQLQIFRRLEHPLEPNGSASSGRQ